MIKVNFYCQLLLNTHKKKHNYFNVNWKVVIKVLNNLLIVTQIKKYNNMLKDMIIVCIRVIQFLFKFI